MSRFLWFSVYRKTYKVNLCVSPNQRLTVRTAYKCVNITQHNYTPFTR